MAMLIFYVGENRFAVECASILRIIPNVQLNKIPNMHAAVAGLLVTGGHSIPVIDFCQLIEKRSTRPFLNSRIILLKDRKHQGRCVGILGEKVDEIVDMQPKEFNQDEFYLQHLPYIDKGHADDKGIVHFLHLAEFFCFLSSEIFHEFRTNYHDS